MADQQILQYIVGQERAGYSESQIRQGLSAQGYQPQQIDAAFKELQVSQMDPLIHEYVQQYARQGTTPTQIFKTLTEQGYAPGKVRRAIIDVFGPGTLPSRHTAVFVIIAIIIIAGGAYFLQAPFSTQDTPQPQAVQGSNDLSASETIGLIIGITRTKGEAAGVEECQQRLRGDDRDRCILDVAIQPNVGNDKLCDQIIDVKLRDTCLMNLVDEKGVGICKRLKLQENIDTCNTIAVLKKTPNT